ncbi:nitroreductase family deazaflavin-dependent oxidoreductase [Oryzobacter telluris]|uniref:nitroreductase family deazaflavin-dependent oxidoreductase n=1 Tax=Oryzobacter telluris TaxID=3149179 RepID=UPI00370D0E90
MGLASDLGYSIAPSTGFQRAVRVVASSRPGAWTLARILPALDRVVSRLSRGRTTAAEVLAGLPVLVVTTTGRRSGLPRSAQLIGVPFAGDVALIGTNFGQSGTPTWVLNLEADPRAVVMHRDVARDVVARVASDAERSEILTLAGQVYVGYPKYFTRVTDRHVRIFVLEQAS